ncbi:MliC family protein [Microbulbifer yueqingensis]|uniref:Membrane-bound lysozyme-inhibitor of c-type lysozyme n=1 Tax=Microbulbifer yueqingensis TaxID=658219 RepID=A0A1G9BDB6_9GAMM|nr:MliC family protein [Microbulbifer yueqingensis]SDK37528.1 Membrane-bound lysozyme-inhibitor of c-type lysozyme [Microbulbifer yueqingensis]
MNRALAALTACAILVPAACDSGTGKSGGAVETRVYRCESGDQLEVKYLIPAQGPAAATMTYGNKLISMHQEPAASGVLFVADKGFPDYRWHTKGRSGTLVLHRSGNGEGEVLLGECTAP